MMGHFIVKVKAELYLDVEAESAIEAERLIESFKPRIVGEDIDFSRYVAKSMKEPFAEVLKVKRFVRLCELCGAWQHRRFRNHICEKCEGEQG